MYRLLTIVLMLLSGFSVAGDLTIQISSVSCIGVDEHARYKYRVGFIVQNTGKKELTIISKSNRISSLDYEVPELVFGHGEMKADGILIIPPRDELGLVILHPDDGAQIFDIYKSKKPLPEKVIVGYQGTAINNGRYGNWEGLIKSPPTKVTTTKLCNP